MVIRQPMTHRVPRDVVDDAVTTCVLSRDNRRPVGRADWSGMKSALEQGAFVREAIDVRRFHVRMPACPELVIAQVVDQDHQEIGFHLARAPVVSTGNDQRPFPTDRTPTLAPLAAPQGGAVSRSGRPFPTDRTPTLAPL